MSRRIYRFGQYSVDPATRELRDAGPSAAWEAALTQARALAGERAVPSSASAAPTQAPLISSR